VPARYLGNHGGLPLRINDGVDVLECVEMGIELLFIEKN